MVRVEPARFAITEVREQSQVQIVGPMKPSLPLINHHRVHSQRFRKEPARHALLPTELLNVAPDDLLDLTSGLHMRSTQSILHHMTHMQGTLRNSLIAKESDRHRVLAMAAVLTERIGERIYDRRTELGLSRDELAIGVHRPRITNVET